MTKYLLILFTSLSIILLFSTCTPTEDTTLKEVDVLIIGGGTGGTAAGIQAARLGAKTLVVEPTVWLGGMLTAAGVSATDGNHHMPAGLWGEFRDSLRKHYGGAEALATGWVSHTQFEPSVGASIFQHIADGEEDLEIWFKSNWQSVQYENDNWIAEIEQEGILKTVKAKVLVDGTDLGDVAAAVGASYDLGMDAASKTGEKMAPSEANNIIQDFTYAAILKDCGEGADKTIPKPANYDPTPFLCSCQALCEDDNEQPHPCETMLTYGKLPNEKYMINWPLHGNDYYANLPKLSQEERAAFYQKAKDYTLSFVYFIQSELGYKNLGLAEDEFPTEDQLPMIPYHREGRRIHGLQRLTVNHILNPYDYDLYKDGIAVGDYPIDHHHAEMPDAPEIDFPPVPSFNIPIGCLIPKSVDHLVMADKAISVTNIVNGSSRLQPVILQIGQAAGVIAALASQKNVSPKDLAVRTVQKKLLDANGYLMPFYDVSPEHTHFSSIQKMAACGLLQGIGEPYKWANRTWFYPDSLVQAKELETGLEEIGISYEFEEEIVSIAALEKALEAEWTITDWNAFGLADFSKGRALRRGEVCVVVDGIVKPFKPK